MDFQDLSDAQVPDTWERLSNLVDLVSALFWVDVMERPIDAIENLTVLLLILKRAAVQEVVLRQYVF